MSPNHRPLGPFEKLGLPSTNGRVTFTNHADVMAVVDGFHEGVGRVVALEGTRCPAESARAGRHPP